MQSQYLHVHKLTSSIFEAQIGKSPNIAQTNDLSGNCEDELPFVCPLPSIARLHTTVSAHDR